MVFESMILSLKKSIQFYYIVQYLSHFRSTIGASVILYLKLGYDMKMTVQDSNIIEPY